MIDKDKLKNLKVKKIEFAPTDMLASKHTLAHGKNNELEEVSWGVPGVIAYSKLTGRYVKVPNGNLKSIEYFMPEASNKDKIS